MKTIIHLLDEYYSEYCAEKHPLHFLTITKDNTKDFANIGYRFRKRNNNDTWFMKANSCDTYANYVRFLKEKENETCNYENYSQKLNTE